MTTITLVRHGETVWNVENRMQGHGDSPLTERGVAQARAVGERLRHETIHAVYSSDLGRSVDTARHIADATGHNIRTDERLRERNVGIFQGLSIREIQQRYPEHWQVRSIDPNYTVPEAESYRQLLERSLGVLSDLATRHSGEQIVAVTHGGVLSIFLRHALGVPLDQHRRFRVPNCGVNIVVHQAEQEEQPWQVHTLGEVHHLRHLAARDDTVR